MLARVAWIALSCGEAAAASSARWAASRVRPPWASNAARRASLSAPPAREANSVASSVAGAGLMGGVPVEPPGIEMPDVADDELRVIVFRQQVRLCQEVGGSGYRT